MGLWVEEVCRLVRVWGYKFLSRWICELMRFVSWRGCELISFLSRSVFELRSFVNWWGYEVVSSWVDKFMRVWVGKFINWGVSKLMGCRIQELLGFREFIGQWVDLSHSSYVSGVFILCWHHKDKKLLSIYRKIKSRDYFIVCTTFVQPLNGFLSSPNCCRFKITAT